jgi:hypothetical protein
MKLALRGAGMTLKGDCELLCVGKRGMSLTMPAAVAYLPHAWVTRNGVCDTPPAAGRFVIWSLDETKAVAPEGGGGA